MSLTPFQMAKRYQRSRDWMLMQAGRAERRGDDGEVGQAEAAVRRIDGWLGDLGFSPREPVRG